MASPTKGIEQLLEAEASAANKVAEAKRRKENRLKQVRKEAQVEIEKYRQKREKQFNELEMPHMRSRENITAKINGDTKVKIDEINKAVDVNKQTVIEGILELVYDIKPELHKNFSRKN